VRALKNRTTVEFHSYRVRQQSLHVLEVTGFVPPLGFGGVAPVWHVREKPVPVSIRVKYKYNPYQDRVRMEGIGTWE
jgi:hypothetical protein